jgi:phospholipase/lecithinase/hemolysin
MIARERSKRTRQNLIFSQKLPPVKLHAQLHDDETETCTNMMQRRTQGLYSLGARRIGVTSLPPMGCLPGAVTLFGGGSSGCVERLNNDSLAFNRKLGAAADAVKQRRPDLKLVVFDIYQPLLDLVNNPTSAGTCVCALLTP